MKFYPLALVVILSCKNQSGSYLSGKWKVLTINLNGQTTVYGTMEFSKEYFITSARSNRPDTFDYILKGDTLITNRIRETEKDISFIQPFNNDSARITFQSLPITFLI